MKTKIILIIAFVIQTLSLFAQKTETLKSELLFNNAELSYNNADYNVAITILNEALEVGKIEFNNSISGQEKYFTERRLADICTKLSDCYIHLSNKDLAKKYLMESSFKYNNPWCILRCAVAIKEGLIKLSNKEVTNNSVKFKKDKNSIDYNSACLLATVKAKFNIGRFGDNEDLKKKLDDEFKAVNSKAESIIAGEITTKTVPNKRS